MNVSVVIPNWNGSELLERNLSFVIAAKKISANRISEIIIVDDGSTDDSVKFLQANFKDEVRLIRHKINRGFSSAANTGVRSAKGDLVCLLNTDVVVTKDFLKNVLPHFKEKKVFGVSLHEEGFGASKAGFVDGFIVHFPIKEVNQPMDTFWVSGGSGVFRRSVWINIHGLDEKVLHPFYWEDVDLCYRALKRGYSLIWEPNAIVQHKHESTISRFKKSKVDIIRERNQLLFIWKNLTSKNLMRKHTAGLVARIIKHPGYLRVVLAALFRMIATKKLNQIEKKESTISDEAIFAKFN